jgi:menaquinone-dependent protoporphyrinogen IX oxidase
MSPTLPRVLFVYFTVTQQTLKVVEAMTETLRKRGCDVQQARIEFIDARYADRFSRFPFKHPYLLVAGMLVPQLRHATGQIRVPDIVREGNYDLVCIGSPTWWLNPCMPIRSFMESDLAGTVLAGKRFAAIVVCHRYWKNNMATVKTLGIRQGGKFVSGIHFISAGGPIGSMLALMSYFGTGVIKNRYLGGEGPPGKPATELRQGSSGVRRRIGGQYGLRQSKRKQHGLISISSNLSQPYHRCVRESQPLEPRDPWRWPLAMAGGVVQFIAISFRVRGSDVDIRQVLAAR